MVNPNDVPNSHPDLASVPDLADEPLEAAWLGRARPADQPTVPIPTVAPSFWPEEDERPGGGDRIDQGRPPQSGETDENDGADAKATRPRRKRSWIRRLVRTVAVLILLGILGLGGVLFYAQRQFNSVERVEVGNVLAPASPGGTNYLIVGSDSRENLDPNVENAAAIFGDGTEEISGQRTDTIQILRIADDGSQHILALPRDLYLPIEGRSSNRINAAYAFGGPELLISTIEGSLGIPIHHYAEIDFGGFIQLVDAVGGVTIDFPNPAFDRKTGLDVPMAGPALLDSTQALAFVRSRSYMEIIDGRVVVDPRGDLGRVKRQQDFLRSLFSELNDPRNQAAALSNFDASNGSVKLDDRLSFIDALGLANELRAFEPNNQWDLVVSHATVPGGAQVLQLDSGASQQTLDFFSN